MAKGWINNNIVRRSCCVHHVSTGVEHNSCEVRPEEEERGKDSCYNTWTPHTTHGHHTCTCSYIMINYQAYGIAPTAHVMANGKGNLIHVHV